LEIEFVAIVSDPTAVAESIEVITQDVVQLESKPLRVRLVVSRPLANCTSGDGA
jgi:hypothetical protein